MKLLRLMTLALAGLLVTPDSPGQRKPFSPRAENFDKRLEHPIGAERARHNKANGLANLQRRLPNVTVDFDDLIGGPRFIRSQDGFLSGPDGVGRSIPATAHAGLAVNDAHRTTKAFLNEHRQLFGFSSETLGAARIQREFVTPHSGAKTVVWQQELDSIPVFEALFISHLTRKGELVSVSSQLLPDPLQAADREEPDRQKLVAAPPISAERAVVRAADSLGEKLVESEVHGLAFAEGPRRVQHFRAAPLKGEVHAQLVWLPLNDTRLRLCWEIIMVSRAQGEMFRLLVDARSGEVWLRHSLTAYLTNASYRVYTSDSPSPFSPGHSIPSTNQPPLVSRVLVTTNALNTAASPNGWINDGDNETRGNNVDAHTDTDDDDLPDLPRPQGSPGRVFDFLLDLTQPPASYSDAAVVQLFYWCNWMHDKLYELGFTEAAGNFQADNFGLGGQGNDPLQADAQDGSGVNNANMSTPLDGSSPRMQMYIFTGPEPDRDGDLDAEVILHEYTHGLSNRRVGGGVGIFRLQSAGMGEGWSDFYGLALLSESGDNVDGAYAAGAYLSYQLGGLGENYYFGIRRYPYSTDLTKNPLTFKDIDPTQASPHNGVPLNPLDSPFSPAFAAEVHNQGEVWCVTLWEARASLIKKHGFEIGNRLILQLVTDGMNFSPANPNFLQARDAILLADQVNNNGANLPELWAAFAKRGMGVSATSPSSSTTTGVRESFDPPDDLVVTPLADFTTRGSMGGPFSPMSQTYSLTNVGTNPVVWTAKRSAGWFNVTPASGTILPGDAAQQVTAMLDNAAGSLFPGAYTDTILFSNANTRVTQLRLATLRVDSLTDYFTEWFTAGDLDIDFQSFTFTPDGSEAFYSVCRQPVTSFPTDPAGGTVVTLSDDSFEPVALSNAVVSIYGTSSNVFFIGSNGYLTQGAGDTTFFESTSAHFSRRRVAGLFTDLDPSAGGTISWRQLSDRAAVTFFGVPELGSGLTNSFQIELFFDGRIRLTYLSGQAINGLVGLSRGAGVPPGFAESDFSTYPACGLPSLTLNLPNDLHEGAGVLTGQASVRLSGPATTNVIVNLVSSDISEVIVPATVVVSSGATNALFDVTVLDDADLDGTQNVIVTATAPGYLSASVRSQVFDNETASLTVVLPGNTMEGAGIAAGVVEVSVEPASGLAVRLISSDTNELVVPPVVIIPAGGTGVDFSALVIDDTRLDGPQNVTVTAHVMNWSDGIMSVVIQDNDPTNLTIILPPRAREGGGTLSHAGTVRLGGTLPTNFVVSLVSSDITELTVPAAVTVLAGEFTAEFDLTIVDDPDPDGTQTVTVTAHAPGFISGTALFEVFDNETPLPPFFPNPPHLASNVAVTANLAWSGGEFTELLVNGDFERGNFNGWVRVPSSFGDFEINTATNDPPSPDGPLPPFEGSFSALAEQVGPGLHQMYQEVLLPAGGQRIALNWADRVRNFFSRFDSFQQYRVEIRDTNNLLLAVAHTTQPGDPLLGNWVTHSFDLTPFAGQAIRIAFVVDPGGFHLGVHVDSVSVAVSQPGSATFDVYFGTNPAPGPAELLGSTTNLLWDLPVLAPATTYYWQIVARTLGAIAGPIWQFTTRGVDHFVWSPIASPQIVNEPFEVTVTAQDASNTTVSNFAGMVSFTGTAEIISPTLFSEDFQDGDFNGWIENVGSYLRVVTNDPAGGSNLSLTLIGGVNQHYDGLTHTLPRLQPEVVNFRVRASRNDTAGGYVVLGSGTNRSERAAFFFMSSDGGMGLYEDVTFAHQIPYVANRWYDISLALSWTNRTVDYYVDQVLVAKGIPFRGTNVPYLTSIALYNFDHTQNWWDDIEFIGSGVARRIAIAPTNSTAFVNGVWSGQLTVLEPAQDVALQAHDGQAHVGQANPIDAVALNDLVLRVEDVPDPAGILSQINYHVTVFNAGPALATGVLLTNSIPDGVALLSFASSQGVCERVGDEIRCNFGPLAARAQATLTFIVEPLRFGSLTNQAVVTRAEQDANVSNNTAVTVTRVAPPLMSISDVVIAEGLAGKVNASFQVTLSSSNRLPASVSFTTSNGTATANGDFVPVSGLLVFPPGSTQQTIIVPVLGDGNNEADETFRVLLNNPVNASLAKYDGLGIILNDDQTEVASMPFVETWEEGRRPFWLVSGTGPFRSQVITSNRPHGGAFHMVMDNALDNGTNARNEVTLFIDLQGWTNLVLRFWAVEFFDYPDGPPPVPFIGGADFDGVAVSTDGIRWYEVQDLRNLTSTYSEITVDLDAAIRAHGLSYAPNFRIRFNEVGQFSAPYDGIAIDDISITGNRAGIGPGPAELLAETCVATNQVIDPGEIVTVSLALTNVGLPPTANLVATLLATGGVNTPSGPQNYGSLSKGGPVVARPFTFRAGGVCGGSVQATLQLQDGGADLGQAVFTFRLGVFSTNQWSFAQTNSILIPVVGVALPYPSSNVVSGIAGTVRKITVTLHNFSHTFPDHVDMLLVGPLGQTCTLVSDAGGALPVTNVTLTLDSTVAERLMDQGPMLSGTFNPTNYGSSDGYPAPAPTGTYGETLDVFKGINPNGAWRLFVYDDTSGSGEGSIAGGWTLEMETSDVNCCSDGLGVDLTLRLTDSPDPAFLERNLNYTMQITNRGPAVATGVILTNVLPGTVEFVSVTASQGGCTNENGQVICELGSLVSNATAVVTITVKTPQTGIITDFASITANEIELNGSNNVRSTITTVMPPGVTVANVSVLESSSTNVSALFNFHLDYTISATASVYFATANVTALAGSDYLGANGQITFLPGETDHAITLDILPDLTDEASETFAINLFNPVNATLNTFGALGTIVDDDPTPSLTVSDVTVGEGNSGNSPAVFLVRLSAPSGQRLQASYSTTSGTASAPIDYTATNGVMVMVPGETNRLITVVVKGDTTNEANETFFLNLSSPINVTLADAQGMATILNDDFLPNISLVSATLGTESCFPTNRAIDPDETVSVSFRLRNASAGSAIATNLVATLLPSAGIIAPDGPYAYGSLGTGASGSRTFRFTANANCGSALAAVLELRDGLLPLGRVTNVFQLGQGILAFSENFDSVSAPNLPAGWAALLTGSGTPWRTTSTNRDTLPNSVMAPNPSVQTTNELTSPPIFINTPQAQLAFRHSFNTESNFDGGTLQISIANSPFSDILAAGGRFVTGGYNGTITFSTPAWTGNSAGFVSVLASLPPAAAGKNIQLRWRLTTDGLVSAVGWFVDTVSINDGFSCCAPPAPYIQSIHLESGMVVLQWTSIPGRTYRVQHKPTIDAPSWLDLPGEVTATATSTIQTDLPGEDTQRFYRVVELR